MSSVAPSTSSTTQLDPGPLANQTRRFIHSREHFFWFLHLTGWLGYAAGAHLGGLARGEPSAYLVVVVAGAMSGMLLSLILRYIYREVWYQSPWIVALGSLGLSYLVALLWTLIRNQVYWDLFQPWYRPDSFFGYFSGVMTSLYVMLSWSGLYFGIKYYQMLQRQTERTLIANAAAHQAQLKMLRYQLNPHFLFNTLNAISTLILERQNDTANECITRLSAFLRYTLETDPMTKVPLSRELEALDLYLAIEKVRFGDRLRLEYRIEDSARAALVPSLITQPIIENAVKYAVAAKKGGASIRISAATGGGYLVVKITDDGPGLMVPSSSSSSGLGLSNTRERLRQVYGGSHSFTIANRETGGVVVTLRLPLTTAK